MPGTGEHPHHQNVENPASPAYPVAAQGNVNIVPEPAAKAHVPAAPEFRNAFGQIGILEILQEVEAENSAQTNGHIGITGKVKVNIQQERNGIHPVKQHGRFSAFPENLDQQGKVVCQNHLFAQAHQEPAQTVGQVFPGMAAVLQFLRHIHIPDNGTGNELGKQGHIGTEGNGVFLHLRSTPVHIDGIA